MDPVSQIRFRSCWKIYRFFRSVWNETKFFQNLNERYILNIRIFKIVIYIIFFFNYYLRISVLILTFKI